MNILVIGGTGLIGKSLIPKLLSNGHEVTVVTRGNVVDLEYLSVVKHQKLNRSDGKALASVIMTGSFDVIIDNLVFNDNDITSILSILTQLEKKPHYVLTSSVAVYNDLSTKFPDKKAKSNRKECEHIHLEDPRNEHDWKTHYANGKRQAEHALIKSKYSKYTILRVNVIDGEHDSEKRTWFWVQRLLDHQGILLAESNRHSTYQPIFVEDLTDIMTLCITQSNAIGKIYNIAGGCPLSVTDYITLVQNALEITDSVICWMPGSQIETEIPGYVLPPFFDKMDLSQDIQLIQCDFNFQFTPAEVWLPIVVKSLLNQPNDSWGYDRRHIESGIIANHADHTEVVSEKLTRLSP